MKFYKVNIFYYYLKLYTCETMKYEFSVSCHLDKMDLITT